MAEDDKVVYSRMSLRSTLITQFSYQAAWVCYRLLTPEYAPGNILSSLKSSLRAVPWQQGVTYLGSGENAMTAALPWRRVCSVTCLRALYNGSKHTYTSVLRENSWFDDCAYLAGIRNKGLRPKEWTNRSTKRVNYRPNEWIRARSLNSYFAFCEIVVKTINAH